MNWETFHVHYIFKNYYDKKRKNVVDQIRFSGSVFLGILSTTFFCGYILKNAYQDKVFDLKIIDLLLILVSLVLLFIIIVINKEYNKKNYIELEDVTKEYKKYIIEKKTKI